ncbi:Hypothetical predicted protein, partial [Podarcis lilfordi]
RRTREEGEYGATPACALRASGPNWSKLVDLKGLHVTFQSNRSRRRKVSLC